MRASLLGILRCAAIAAVPAAVHAQAPVPSSLPAATLPAMPDSQWRGEAGLVPDAPYRASAAANPGAPSFGRAHAARDAGGAGPILQVETVPSGPGALMNARPSHRIEVYRFGRDSSVLLAGKKRGVQVLLRVYSY